MRLYEDLDLMGAEDIRAICSDRPGEKRLGHCIQPLDPSGSLAEDLGAHPGRYVVLGVPEDIGPRANLGRGGANSAWEAFLPAFLNIQSNVTLSGEQVLLLGCLRTEDLMEECEGLDGSDENSLKKLRESVGLLDERLAPVIRAIVEAGKEAVVIGGGHNNSFPNIKGAAEGCHHYGITKGPTMGCINLDPHADLRQMEGRHSGNGFTAAKELGYLEKYAMVGLHKNHNSRHILNELANDPKLHYATFDDLVEGRFSFEHALEKALDFIGEHPYGIEVDLDALANVPVSAETPSGFAVEQARYFVMRTASLQTVPYLHIAEGAPALRPEEEGKVGKLIAYLVSDHIRKRENP